MSELDKVLDTVMRLKEDIIEKSASSEDKNEVMDALKEQKRQRIINEIKEEYKQQAENYRVKEFDDRGVLSGISGWVSGKPSD